VVQGGHEGAATGEGKKIMKTKHGKIARLPKEVREQLNRRLENGCNSPPFTIIKVNQSKSK